MQVVHKETKPHSIITFAYVANAFDFVVWHRAHSAWHLIGAMQDISERVAYIKAIEHHNLRLKEIAWTQAHLVRAPLARILGLIQLLSDLDNDECTRQRC